MTGALLQVAAHGRRTRRLSSILRYRGNEVAQSEVRIRFVDVDSEEALGIARRPEIYAYGDYIFQCSRMHRCPVLTLDGGLIRAAEEIGLEVVEVE